MRLCVSHVSVKFVEFSEGHRLRFYVSAHVELWLNSYATIGISSVREPCRRTGAFWFYSAREPCRRVEDSWEEQYALKRVAVTFGTLVSVGQS